MNKLSLTALLVILTASTCVYAKPAKADNQGDKPRMQMRAEAIKAFDKDGDGKLSEEERTAMQEARKGKGEEMRAAALKAFDKDGDGKLSEEERTAMQEARKAQGGKRKGKVGTPEGAAPSK